MEVESVEESGVSSLLIVGLIAIVAVAGLAAVMMSGLFESPSSEVENQAVENYENQSVQENEVPAILTGSYTNDDFLASIAQERQDLIDQYMSTIYPAPVPLPDKFNCIWVPLPIDWKDILQQVDEIKEMGFNSVHFGVPVLRDDNGHPYSVGLDLVEFYVNEFHREGLHVILTTNAAGPWFGTPNQGDADFMEEYSQVIYEIADIAEDFDVAAFLPANEYQLLAQSQDIIRYMPQEILPEVRARYSGPVGFNTQGTLDYSLEGYDFVLMMGRTTSINPVTRDMALDHHSGVVSDDLDFMQSLAADAWYEFLMFSGDGNYWEPNNGVPEFSVTAEEAAQYAEMVLETAYNDLKCIMPCYDTGFYTLEDPLPELWQEYFSSYNQPEQAAASWSTGDLDVIHEVLFPEWDGMYTPPWNTMMDPGYWTEISLTGNVTASGNVRCEWPDYIQLTNFNFQGDGREIEIRLADNNIGELLECSARLMGITDEIYENATLDLYYPDFLKSHMFNRIIIYDATNRETLGEYEFQPE